MRALTAFELVELWEQGWSRDSIDRALIMAGAACPELDSMALLHLSIGRRDALLLRARELTFGPHVECLTDCPSCGAAVELAFNIDDVRIEPEACESPHRIEIDGFHIALRPADTEDLRAASCAGGIEAARAVLLRRCVAVWKDGVEAALTSISERLVPSIVNELARCDPQADVRLAAVCPACRHNWTAIFDIVPFLWKEIQRAAQKLLRQVHTLASAYGWSESEILSLSAWRRQVYLNIAGP